MAAGWFAPGSSEMHIRFTPDLAGYLWLFPRRDHVSVGIDYYQGQWPFMDDAQAKALYAVRVREGRWSPKNYPPPPPKW